MDFVHFYQSSAKSVSFGDERPKVTNINNLVLETSLKPLMTFKPSFESIRLFCDDDVVEIIDTTASSLRDFLSLFHTLILNIKATEAQLGGNLHLPYCRRELTLLQYMMIMQRMMIC